MDSASASYQFQPWCSDLNVSRYLPSHQAPTADDNLTLVSYDLGKRLVHSAWLIQPAKPVLFQLSYVSEKSPCTS